MTHLKPLAVDANILLRAVFGKAVPSLLERYGDVAALSTPDICLQEVTEHLPLIARRRGVDLSASLRTLELVLTTVAVIDSSFYLQHKADARRRIDEQDAKDWPVLATALLLDCPIWTEDRDFFGTGVATWTTRNVGIYLAGSSHDI